MAFQNFFSSKISNDIGAADNTIIVDTAPSATSGRMVLEARNSTQREVIKYTGVSGNTLTGVTRGQGGTTGKTHVKGALIEQNVTAEDLQDLYDAFNSFAASATDWRLLAGNPVVSVTAKGNRSYDVTFTTSPAALLAPGMRGRSTRTVAAPTQCTSLNGTNQFYSKASPSGMTFTNNFVVSGWVKLTSYQNGVIAGRLDTAGGNGWELDTTPAGQLELTGYNASTANYARLTSYQSIPLNKWVHVAAQLDMTSTTNSPTVNYMMMDGADVPAVVTRSGTSPTALVQGTAAFGIGARASTSTIFLPGKVAQVAVYSAKVTQATILASMHQKLAGTETSLVSAYSFDGAITDLNTVTANNLTANGGAVATTVDSPFAQQASGTPDGSQDYFIIQKVNGAVVTVQVPEGCTLPTTGGITAISYSGVKAPYGMPVQRGKWQILTNCYAGYTSGGTPTGYQYTNYALTVPVGEWMLGYQGVFSGSRGAAGSIGIGATLSTTTSTEVDPNLSGFGYANSVTDFLQNLVKQYPYSVAAATPFYLIIAPENNATYASVSVAPGSFGRRGTTLIVAENAYL